jgi:aminotransferase in exopolysaccharide biosynthesis
MFDPVVKFIRALYGTDAPIPLHEPRFSGNEKEYLADCIDSTYVSSVGKYVDRFEEIVAAFTGAKRAVAIVNGTEALHLALRLAGVEPGTEVITQPLTFIATANAIHYTGAQPVFVDVDPETLGLSPASLLGFLEEFATIDDKGNCINRSTGRRIKACVPMHTFGHPVRIDLITEICSRYNIVVVEDAAESLGSTFLGRHTGTFGKLGVLSFNGNKIITTGGGGMILTDDDELGNLAKHLSTQAKVKHAWEFRHDMSGYNYRLPNLNAALGVAQMEKLGLLLEKKRILAHQYRDFFAELGIPFVSEPEGARSNYWLNSILMKDREQRDDFLAFTNSRGIMTRPAWNLMTRLPMYENNQAYNLTNAGWIEDRLVNIPSSPIL